MRHQTIQPTKLSWHRVERAPLTIPTSGVPAVEDRAMAMGTPIEMEAERAVARFLAQQPTPEAIIAFRPSAEVAERAYALIARDRDGDLSAEERRELDTYMYIEHLMRLVKAEAHARLGHQVS